MVPLLRRLIPILALSGLALTVAAPPASADDTSYVYSWDSSSVNLRPCPQAGPNYGATDCQGAQALPNGASVLMLCWTTGTPPYDGASGKWFWVREAAGAPFPGREGYVWSDLVQAQRPDTPACSSEEMSYDLRSTTPMVSLAQGSEAPYGYRYDVALTGAGGDRDVTITCYDTVSPEGFWSFVLHTDASGNASTGDQCYSGDSGDHWVTADDGMVSSNTVSW